MIQEDMIQEDMIQEDMIQRAIKIVKRKKLDVKEVIQKLGNNNEARLAVVTLLDEGEVLLDKDNKLVLKNNI